VSSRVLLHICCGPCASATQGYWRERGVELVGFFYNPNIQPLLEFRRRLEGVRDLSRWVDLPVIEDLSYDPTEWFATVCGQQPVAGESRCVRCIALRLDRAAHQAAAEGCEAFSTTLSISPWQNHEAIQLAGAQASARHGVEFLYRDLRALYPESRRLSQMWGLYRQKYCGCIVSEWERYRDAKERPQRAS
jgi:predicted adenine nucleotide alpha hydrolase (AANH) superfamily ATPase